MDSHDARLGLVDGLERVFLFQHPSVLAAGNVVRDSLEVSRRDQIFQRLRRFLLVQRVLIDDFVERRQILSQRGFARADNALVVHRQRNRQQNQNHADDHHHLDQRETAIAGFGPEFHLPVLVLRAVQSDLVRLAVNIENVLPTPRIRVFIILHGTYSPFLFSHGIDGDPAQKFYFFTGNIYTGNQRVEIRRIAFAPHLDLERVPIGGVFVAIDGVTDHPEVLAQLVLALPINRDSYQRKRRPHQNGQDGGRNDQLDQGKPVLSAGNHGPSFSHI